MGGKKTTFSPDMTTGMLVMILVNIQNQMEAETAKFLAKMFIRDSF